jgi:hypothetical protein
VNVALWVYELAARFWREAGGPPPLPRDLAGVAVRTLELDVIPRRGLRLATVAAELRRWGAPLAVPGPDRRLRACLAAWGGHGLVWLEEDDPEDEQRFSVAHEVAHFLRDYWWPRCQAERALGWKVREVLDGERPGTPGERLAGLLRGVAAEGHLHLLARDSAGRACGRESVSEREADRLAYELLAPAREVLGRLQGVSGGTRRVRAAAHLRSDFGLPQTEAGRYAAVLFPEAPLDPLFEKLEKIVSNFGGQRRN